MIKSWLRSWLPRSGCTLPCPNIVSNTFLCQGYESTYLALITQSVLPWNPHLHPNPWPRSPISAQVWASLSLVCLLNRSWIYVVSLSPVLPLSHLLLLLRGLSGWTLDLINSLLSLGPSEELAPCSAQAAQTMWDCTLVNNGTASSWVTLSWWLISSVSCPLGSSCSLLDPFHVAPVTVQGDIYFTYGQFTILKLNAFVSSWRSRTVHNDPIIIFLKYSETYGCVRQEI